MNKLKFPLVAYCKLSLILTLAHDKTLYKKYSSFLVYKSYRCDFQRFILLNVSPAIEFFPHQLFNPPFFLPPTTIDFCKMCTSGEILEIISFYFKR